MVSSTVCLIKDFAGKSKQSSFNILLEKAFAYPYHAISKGFNALYRFILMLLLIYSLLNMYKRNIQDPVFAFSLITISYLISRTIFFSLNSNFETRYMVTCIPFIEILVCLTILSIILLTFYHIELTYPGTNKILVNKV